jgi:hypothetical protein
MAAVGNVGGDVDDLVVQGGCAGLVGGAAGQGARSTQQVVRDGGAGQPGAVGPKILRVGGSGGHLIRSATSSITACARWARSASTVEKVVSVRKAW